MPKGMQKASFKNLDELKKKGSTLIKKFSLSGKDETAFKKFIAKTAEMERVLNESIMSDAKVKKLASELSAVQTEANKNLADKAEVVKQTKQFNKVKKQIDVLESKVDDEDELARNRAYNLLRQAEEDLVGKVKVANQKAKLSGEAARRAPALQQQLDATKKAVASTLKITALATEKQITLELGTETMAMQRAR